MAIGATGLLSVDEVARVIRRHPEVVRRQARAGRLPGEKIGRGWFFRPARLAEAGYHQFADATPPARPEVAPPDATMSQLLAALADIRNSCPADVSLLAGALLAQLERGRQFSEPWYAALEQRPEAA